VHRRVRSDRESLGHRVRVVMVASVARSKPSSTGSSCFRSQPAEFLFALLRGIGGRAGFGKGGAQVSLKTKAQHAPDLLRQGQRRGQTRPGPLALDRRGREENGGTTSSPRSTRSSRGPRSSLKAPPLRPGKAGSTRPGGWPARCSSRSSSTSRCSRRTDSSRHPFTFTRALTLPDAFS